MLTESATLIAAIAAFNQIYQRHLKRTDDVFIQRQELCNEILHNCKLWSEALKLTFDGAAVHWTERNIDSAQAEIVRLQKNIDLLNYQVLHENKVIQFLKKDRRFLDFSNASVAFYQSALHVKQIAYGEIGSEAYGFVNPKRIKNRVTAWKEMIDKIYDDINKEHVKLKTITPV